MADDKTEPLENFESWLLRRVAKAVEADEVPADLLTELQAAMEEARDRPQEESHAEAVREWSSGWASRWRRLSGHWQPSKLSRPSHENILCAESRRRGWRGSGVAEAGGGE